MFGLKVSVQTLVILLNLFYVPWPVFRLKNNNKNVSQESVCHSVIVNYRHQMAPKKFDILEVKENIK